MYGRRRDLHKNLCLWKRLLLNMDHGQNLCWSVKNGRPDSTPECQNTSNLPHLLNGAASCNETESRNGCFYFRCTTCLRFLALDQYNKDYRTKIEFIPIIYSTKPKDKNLRGLFNEDPGYRGKVDDFFGEYLSNIEGWNGIGINSWTSDNTEFFFDGATKIFEALTFYQKILKLIGYCFWEVVRM